MLDLLSGGTEETFGVIERELRCGFWSWDLRSSEMRWSRGYYDLLGIEPGSVTPSFAAILQITHPDDRGPQAEVERVIRQASTIRRKFRVIRPGGRTAWLSCQIIVFVNTEGIAEKAVGICTDVTAHQDQLYSLRISDERYRALVKASGAVVWIAKADGQLHEVLNCDHRGEVQGTVLDSGWMQLIHPDDKEKTVRARDEGLREKRAYEVVHRIRRPDGSFNWKRSTGQPIVDAAGNVKEWLGISVDLDNGSGRGQSRRITGAQIRAARGLLRWSVVDLAKAASASRATIRRLEEVDGASSPNDAALPTIEAALSKAGVEFFFPETGKPGVRPR
ncbi:PAS domain-containing protein [Bradyrhizobium centrosematis]|uniref:PAS domain-containing protein n=1 Tax=Bradyrhizobium centrosematis TaxID=1300039 RepID=UPI00388D3EE0